MPPMCAKNMLTINKEPTLESLTKFENVLIAKMILFMFIYNLPVSRMSALKGKMTAVPIQEEDIWATVEAPQRLPRTPDQAELVTYVLKKKLEYQQTVGRPELVDPRKMIQALQTLKSAGNPHYQQQHDSVGGYERRCTEDDPEGYNIIFPGVTEAAENEMAEDDVDTQADEGDQEEESEKEYDAQQDPVKRNQYVPGEDDTCLIQNNPEMLRRLEDSVINIAPGEGRRPVGLLYSNDWDIQAFPRLHNADGSQGLYQENRPTKISDLQFFQQRLLNINPKFREDPSYLYAAVIFTEKKQIHNNMSMSFTSGRKVVGPGGKIKYEHHEAWNVLGGIKNSPRFWRPPSSMTRLSSVLSLTREGSNRAAFPLWIYIN